jgi:hypothetical protein
LPPDPGGAGLKWRARSAWLGAVAGLMAFSISASSLSFDPFEEPKKKA